MKTIKKALALFSLSMIAATAFAPAAIAYVLEDAQGASYITKQTSISKGVGSVGNATVNACGFLKLSNNTRYMSNGTILKSGTDFSFVQFKTGAVVLDLLNDEYLNFEITEAKFKEKSLTFNSPKQETLQNNFLTACN